MRSLSVTDTATPVTWPITSDRENRPMSSSRCRVTTVIDCGVWRSDRPSLVAVLARLTV
ncbi:hypothetical protein D3C73_1207000 [compost metagenome]